MANVEEVREPEKAKDCAAGASASENCALENVRQTCYAGAADRTALNVGTQRSRDMEITPLNLSGGFNADAAERVQGSDGSGTDRSGTPNNRSGLREAELPETSKESYFITFSDDFLTTAQEASQSDRLSGVLDTATKLAVPLSIEQRMKTHRELADQFKTIAAQFGDDGIKDTVRKLNESLAEQGSPYVFNVARMSNGQDFLTMRQIGSDGRRKFLATLPFSEDRAENQLTEAGKRFAHELDSKQRQEAMDELSEQFRLLRQSRGERAVNEAVQKLNDSLAAEKSPYVFNVATMSNGQEFLTLRNAGNRRFIETKAITDEAPANRPAGRNDAKVEEVPVRPLRGTEATSKTEHAASITEPFMQTGRTFAKSLSPVERKEAHQQLAEQLKMVREESGEKGLKDAVSKLNHYLEQQNSPYVFNLARMSNGQDFLTLRAAGRDAKERNFLSTLAVSEEPVESKVFAAGIRFSQMLAPTDLATAHENLSAQLKSLYESKGSQAVDEAISKLNETLAEVKSPYVFNTVKMANGQQFLTLRNAEGRKFISTRTFAAPGK